MQKRPRRWIRRMQFCQDVVFSAHVVRGLHLAAERWAPQDHLLFADRYRIGEVGVSAGKLADHERTSEIREVAPQVRLKPRQIEFFARAYSAGRVLKGAGYGC